MYPLLNGSCSSPRTDSTRSPSISIATPHVASHSGQLRYTVVGMATSKPTLAGNSGGTPLTVDQLLNLHPFPAEWAKDKRIEKLWHFDLSCTPEQIWPHIADTSRMNRALGTAEMHFEERDGKRY